VERHPSPAALAGLERRCFAEPWDEATLIALLANPAVGAWTLCGERGQPRAFLMFQCAASEAEILRLGVPPEWRRRGYARRLLGLFLAWCGEEGIRRVFLEVRHGNVAARRLYATASFDLVARRAGYYRDPPGDALVLEWRSGAA
jgi:ribosomal-protein-alanine N-acetyltransferase